MTTTRNSVPQRGWAVGYLRTASTVSGSPASRAWIVMCSAPWYWKVRCTSEVRPIRMQVAQEDRDLDDALDHALHDPRLAAGDETGDEQGDEEEEAQADDQGEAQHQGHGALAQVRGVGGSPVGGQARRELVGGGDAGRPDQPAGADDQRLVQDHQPTDQGQRGPARAPEAGLEPLVGPDDAPVGVAQGDSDRVAPAHEHALDQGLAAVGEPSHGVSLPAGNQDGGPGGPPCDRKGSGSAVARRRRPLRGQRPVCARSIRRWNRSTWPAVSTIICLPVKNGWQLLQTSTRSDSPRGADLELGAAGPAMDLGLVVLGVDALLHRNLVRRVRRRRRRSPSRPGPRRPRRPP